jgi:hypothetical protein
MSFCSHLPSPYQVELFSDVAALDALGLKIITRNGHKT